MAVLDDCLEVSNGLVGRLVEAEVDRHAVALLCQHVDLMILTGLPLALLGKRS